MDIKLQPVMLFQVMISSLYDRNSNEQKMRDWINEILSLDPRYQLLHEVIEFRSGGSSYVWVVMLFNEHLLGSSQAARGDDRFRVVSEHVNPHDFRMNDLRKAQDAVNAALAQDKRFRPVRVLVIWQGSSSYLLHVSLMRQEKINIPEPIQSIPVPPLPPSPKVNKGDAQFYEEHFPSEEGRQRARLINILVRKGIPPEEFVSMSEVQLLSLKGIRKISLARLRAAQEAIRQWIEEV